MIGSSGASSGVLFTGAVSRGRQHFLYFFPLPHGQGSFRPAVFMPAFLSEPRERGKPSIEEIEGIRATIDGVKAGAFGKLRIMKLTPAACTSEHGTPPFQLCRHCIMNGY